MMWLAALVTAFISLFAGPANTPQQVTAQPATAVQATTTRATTVKSYMDTAMPLFERFALAEMEWIEAHEALTERPERLQDKAWRDRVSKSLTTMQETSSTLAALDGPADVSKVRTAFRSLATETKGFSDRYVNFMEAMRAGDSKKAIEHRDIGVRHLERMGDVITTLGNEMETLSRKSASG